MAHELDPPLSSVSIWTVDDVINGRRIETDPPLYTVWPRHWYKCAQNGAIKLEIYQNQKRERKEKISYVTIGSFGQLGPAAADALLLSPCVWIVGSACINFAWDFRHLLPDVCHTSHLYRTDLQLYRPQSIASLARLLDITQDDICQINLSNWPAYDKTDFSDNLCPSNTRPPLWPARI